MTYRGSSCLAAFINKGRSFRTVRADDVAAQIHKLARIPQLNLAALVVVGDLHDEPQANFIKMAGLLHIKYLIIDATDVARLLVAAHKICPKDGFSFSEGACKQCGFLDSAPIELLLSVHEEPLYTKLPSPDEDISSRFVKQYKVNILTDSHYSKRVLRKVVKNATREYRHSMFYRDAQIAAQFGQREADAIFLFVYQRMEDVPSVNWICRTSWIRPDLSVPEWAMPRSLGGEWFDDFQIDWNPNYDQMKQFRTQYSVKKDVWTQSVEQLLIRGSATNAVTSRKVRK